MRNFLITGLPRSRTAWMAAFMSTCRVLCRHEPLKALSSIKDMPSVMLSDNHTHVGASDSGAGLFLPWIMANMPMPVLVIERDLRDVQLSMSTIGFPIGDALEQLLCELRAYRNHPDVMWVAFDSLNEKRTMLKIWEHLVPGLQFDNDRFELFRELNIEADVDSVKQYALSHQNQQRNLLKETRLCLGSVQQ